MSTDEPDQPRQSWQHLLADDPHGGAGLRLGLAAALAIHAAVFAVTFPTIAQAPPAEPEEVLIRYPLTTLAPPPERPPEPILIEPPIARPQGPPVVDGPPEETIVSPTIEQQPPSGPAVIEIEHRPPTPPPPPPDPPDSPHPILVLEPPELLHEVRPRYTEQARLARLEGTVILELVIDPDGRVASTKVLRSLPLGLTKRAVDAVAQWRFAPSTFNGRPVSVRYVLTVRFTLD
jgi:TonB family protein